LTAAIAIVGLACRFPGAASPRDLWENVLAKRREFRRIPAERLRMEDYFSLDPEAHDCIYAGQAAVIEGYEFDRERFKVAGNTFRSTDLTHWLALDIADQALRDAGFPDGAGLPRDSTGVLLGNTLTGEFSRASLMRLRWPYVRRVVDARLASEDWERARRTAFLAQLENAYKAPFAEADGETLAGGLSNTIAGRICNHFHLRGCGYTIDGACSSSLLAVAQGCSALLCGELDVALVGGVDLSLDPFELVGFSKAGALARSEMRVYDSDSGGFLPGEGCGIAVLMRHQDTIARGQRCYAIIRGWGISSDGGGGITRPEVAGQRLAIERAYRRAGFGPDTVQLFEGHGTGTAVGDEVELRALAEARRHAPDREQASLRPAVISSIKANIGHTKAAAGVAGLIKAALALDTAVIPPNTGLVKPRSELNGRIFRAVDGPEPWPRDAHLRAGVSSFGFGGINVHVAMEAARDTHRASLTPRERMLGASHQEAEVLMIGAPDTPTLLERLELLATYSGRLSCAELSGLASAVSEWSGPQRASLVAASPAQLENGLRTLIARLHADQTHCLDMAHGLFLGNGERTPRIAFLLPGQAAPVYPDGGALVRRFDWLKDIYERAALTAGSATSNTALAQPAIVASEVAALRLFRRIGIEADVAIGHSLGELAALHWAGALAEDAVLDLARARGKLMSEVGARGGAMVSIAADAATVAAMLSGGAVIACVNAEHQTIASGDIHSLDELMRRCRTAGLQATRLPVEHAFHSPLMAPATEPLRDHLQNVSLRAPQRRVISTVTGAELGPADDVGDLLVRQLTEPVRFMQAAATLANVDVCVETGPGAILSNLVQVPAIAVDAGGPSLQGLLRAIAACFALGAPVDRAALFTDRLIRPFALPWRPRFFANPCELAPAVTDEAPRVEQLHDSQSESLPVPDASADPLEVLRHLVAERAELPLQAVAADSRLLRDLHMNSISVGQLVADAARLMGVPPPPSVLEYADASISEIAAALSTQRALRAMGDADFGRPPAGVDDWVRAFAVERVEAPPPRKLRVDRGGGAWRIFAPQGHPHAKALLDALTPDRGPGVVACITGESDDAAIPLLVEAARCALDTGGCFLVVHNSCCAASLARSLYLEARALAVCVIDMPAHSSAIHGVLAELDATGGYHEVRHDGHGRRSAERLRVLPDVPSAGSSPLSSQDVLLVSGGGKGIGAECALALASESGAKLAILGRSDPRCDDELAANLQRFTVRGIVYRYYRTDITDAQSTADAISQARRELGPITALLHAAGTNRPTPLRELDDATVRETMSAKVSGLRHLLASLAPRELRLAVTFGSIIARTGMRGEAHYAIANSLLADVLQRYSKEHPDCRCLNLEWSVWSGAGMGEKLARVDTLLAEGITPIPIATGITWLRHFMSNPPPSLSVVLAGRFGDPPTLQLHKPELPFLRFLERPVVYYPGIELIVESDLSPASDPYLDDHVIDAERVFPAVMGLEAMAQAAMAVLGRTDPPSFADVEFSHPIVVGADKVETLRVAALVHRADEVDVVVRCAATAFQVDHFRCRCRFEPPVKRRALVFPTSKVAVDPRSDLYGKLLFHGRRFQRVEGYRVLRAAECIADIGRHGDEPWFARTLAAELVLADPATRDAGLHAIQACIPHVQVLPVSVERIQLGAVDASGPWVAAATERSHDADSYLYDLEVVAADGRVRECWQGLRLKRFRRIEADGRAAALLLPYMERRLGDLIPHGEFSIDLDGNGDGARRARADRSIVAALTHTQPGTRTITRRPDGKPEVNGAYVSAAHAGDLTLAVASRHVVACDFEWVAPRADSAWTDLLGGARRALADAIAVATREDFDTAATRVWSALECLKKAEAGPATPLSVAVSERDGWVVLNAGRHRIATFVTALDRHSSSAVLAVLGECRNQCALTNTGT
jgi:enediyne polyketide synthase